MSATLDDLLVELRAIRAAVEKSGPRVDSQPTSRPASGDFADEPIPQPDAVHPNPGSVRIHFGKNNGIALAGLNERQLSFYAKKHEPQLKRDGSPFDDRPQDIELRNAARTLWHTKRGTLVGLNTTRPAQAPRQAENLDEDVPF